MKNAILFLAVIFVSLALCAAVPCAADSIAVNWDGSGDYLTIQAAIDPAFDGDTIVVADGTYTGVGNRDIDFKGKAITVRSENGPENCIIDCNGTAQENHRGFYFHSGEDADSVLSGFTIKNGYYYDGALAEGGGIFCLNEGTEPTIRNCIVTDNEASHGGGIGCYRSDPRIMNCTITKNSTGSNYGGGLYLWDSSLPQITGCTIADNSAIYGGGAIYSGYNSNPEIVSSIIWNNSSSSGADEISGSATVYYSDVKGGYSGAGNINTDPCFVDRTAGDFHLQVDSPCINAGDPNYSGEPGESDIDGEPRLMVSRVDMGSDEYFLLTTSFIEVAPTAFEFYLHEGDPNSQSQILTIQNGGIGTLNWVVTEECSWLEVDPNTGSSSGDVNEVTLTVDIAGLNDGTYNCDLIVSDPCACNNPRSVHVSLVVYGPEIALSSDQFSFTATEGGVDPCDQLLQVTNTAGGMLNWVITYDCNWLNVDPNFGISRAEPNEVTLSADITGLSLGLYTCTLTVSDPCAWNNPQVVEVYLQVLSEGATDFGDCPAPYPTLLADDGAGHTIDPNIFLGSIVDEELDGLPSADANGDDANGLPDEDGVFFQTLIIPGNPADVNIFASANGFLDAWIDFNNDGDWSDPCEQIFTSLPLGPGSNLLAFDVPHDADANDTYARFRFSTVGGLEPTGPAPDGEVEDYHVVIIDCFDPDDSNYDNWVMIGKPGSWCCAYQHLGDGNGDGYTNIQDLMMIFKPAYNTVWTDPRYKPGADCSRNGFVAIQDLMICFKPNYNTTHEVGYDCEHD